MSHVPHEIAEDFPDHAAQIGALKQADARFARLLQQYHEVNRAIHRAETDVAPTDDLHMQRMRKERVQLKDVIAARLASV